MKKEVNMKKLILSMFLPLMIAGCTGNDIENPDKEIVDGSHKRITVSTSIVDVVETRGTPIYSESQMKDFGFFCSYTSIDNWDVSFLPNKMFNEKMVRNTTTGLWEYALGNPVEWDQASAADKYTFFAYSPFESAINGIRVASAATDPGIPVLTYQAPTDVTNQPDLMIAIAKKDIHPTGHPVSLQMTHALTAIGFLLSGHGETVTGISITGISDVATLSIDGGISNLWDNHGAIISHDLTAAITDGAFTVDATPRNPLTADGYLMMIPQTLTSDAKVIITLEDNQMRELDLSTLPNWEAGKKVIYQINLNP